ncbi:PQQ-binding-like beta-propeller repeat protein [Streptomyces sp.]|uniref:outer membrane protein assembly factor BamB family protein n=1 Tax=Streptomyces sp. TaxID=1931 RepID=UPI002D38EC6A|nr:PQQ-binding-like beta-propeller repeat protein [Streptomyces sp.]HZF91524.1 PQQ-binding-like beta-propeller repeat protein [Streptomyces sp.]
MARERARDIWQAGCGLVLGVGLLATLAGDGGSGTSDGPLERPNTLEVAWTSQVPGRALDVADMPAAVSDRLLAIPRGETIGIVDTRDGHRLSTLRSTAAHFAPVGFSDGVVLAAEQEFRGAPSLSAYDSGTGRKLWQRRADPTAREGGGRGWPGNLPFLPGQGPVLETADGRLVGLAPRTGTARWSEPMPVPRRCERYTYDEFGLPNRPYETVTTPTRIVFLSSCPGTFAELKVMNPADGRILWKKRVGRWRESVRLNAAGHAIGVLLDNDTRVFTDSGEEVLRRKGNRQTEMWPVGRAQGVVYLSEQPRRTATAASGSRAHALHAVRAGTGTPLWKRTQGFAYGNDLTSEAIVGSVDADGAYGGNTRWSVGDARLQGPGASSLTDFAGRQSARVPWPVAGTFVGMSGDLLIVRSEERDGTVYTALRPAHRAMAAEQLAALAGAKREDWPDACRLLGAGFLSELGRDYVRLPVKGSRTVFGTRLPHPSECRFATESGAEGDIFTVTVRWVAPDERAARTYAASGVPWGCHPALGRCATAEITQPRRGVYLYTNRVGLEAVPVAHATVASGRHVFGISAVKAEAHQKRLVRRVALHLSRFAAADRT